MAYDKLYIDFCSSKIVVLVEDTQGKLPLRYAIEHVDQDTIRQGQIYNLETTAQKIRKAVEAATEKEKLEPDFVYVGFSDPEVEFITSVGMSACGTPDNPSEITEKHLEEAISNSRAVKLEEGKIIVQTIPIEFSVDSKSDIKHPIGMLGVRLEVKSGLVTAKKSSILNYKKAIEKAGFYADKFYYQPVSEIFALPARDEKENGVLFIDIGRDLTNFGIIADNKIRHVGTIQLGGINLNKDLKYYFGISIEKAEEIKKEIAKILPTEEESKEKYVLNKEGRKSREVTVGTITKYFQDRLAEIFEMIKEETISKDFRHDFNLVKITGGTSEIENIDKLAGEILGVDSEVFYPSQELESELNSWNLVYHSSLSSAIALYKFVNQRTLKEKKTEKIGELPSLKSIFKKFFMK